MAIVKAPALSLDASGNLGGICYSKFRGLNIARGAWSSKLTFEHTAPRLVVEGRMTTVSQAWSGTLTEEERQKWNDATTSQVRVSRGMTKYKPNGYQYFLEVNLLRLRIGLALKTVPFAGLPDASIAEIEVEWDSFMSEVKITPSVVYNPLASGFYVDVFRAGPYTVQGRHALAGEYRFLKLWSGLIGGEDNTVAGLKYYWYKVRWLWSKGATGNWFEKQVYTG